MWASPAGCLMFSFTCQVQDGATLPFLQYVVALSIVQAIQTEAAHALSTTFVVCVPGTSLPPYTLHTSRPSLPSFNVWRDRGCTDAKPRMRFSNPVPRPDAAQGGARVVVWSCAHVRVPWKGPGGRAERRCCKLNVGARQDSSSMDVVEVRIKWPNDVYGPRGVKIGGVLCESTYDMEDKMFNVTVGASSAPSLVAHRIGPCGGATAPELERQGRCRLGDSHTTSRRP